MAHELDTIARRVFLRARDKARENIDAGRLTHAEADAKLLPWAAAAARAGADMPELADLALAIPFKSGQLLAEAVMHTAEWVAVLVAARDAAMLRHGAGQGAPGEIAATRDLVALCDGLRLKGVPGILPFGAPADWAGRRAA